jgi:hypothetical protein
MADTDQSQGRKDNGAIPESEAKEVHGGGDKENAQKGAFKADYGGIPAPNDFEGPAGDPVEGAR